MKKDTKIAIGAAIVSGVITYNLIGYEALKFAAQRNLKRKSVHTPDVHHELKKEDLAFLDQAHFIDLEITTFDDLKLKGKLLPASVETNKVIILVHGYHSTNFRDWAYFLRFYHDLGYNILLPNNRAHGDSEGKYTGFGWLDRLDLLEWIHEIQQYYAFKPLQIVLHGLSMGGATVLMASGEDLSQDVKCIISDCSYTNIIDEFRNILKNKKIPSSLLIPNAESMSKRVLGYDIEDADATKQVANSKTPTLFIHGDQDDFVPTYMVYELYKACAAPKDLLVVEGANHADSYMVNQPLYESTVKAFLNKYVH